MNEAAEPMSRRELVRYSLRWLLGILLLFGLMVALAQAFGAPLRQLGRTFFERCGYAGMTFGTFMADGFHFPVPPQFYMLMAITAGVSQPVALAAITAGSLAGGFAGYTFAGRLARFPAIARRLEKVQALALRAFARFGYRAAILASLLPIAYSLLCYLAGIHRLPRRVFGVLSLCRIPKLILYYYLVRLGWSVQ